MSAARVACHQLGFTDGVHCDATLTDIVKAGAGIALFSGDYSTRYEDFALDDVRCSSDTLTELSQCSSVGVEHENCGDTEAVLLSCSNGRATCPAPPPGPPVALRLVNDANRNDRSSGILEASLDGGVTYGPVCDDYFDRDNNGKLRKVTLVLTRPCVFIADKHTRAA